MDRGADVAESRLFPRFCSGAVKIPPRANERAERHRVAHARSDEAVRAADPAGAGDRSRRGLVHRRQPLGLVGGCGGRIGGNIAVPPGDVEGDFAMSKKPAAAVVAAGAGPGVGNGNGSSMLREHAEQQFAAELEKLAKVDDRTRPPNWRLSPWAVSTYILGG